MSEKTNIEVTLRTWQDLNRRKRGPGESFDDVIQRLLNDEADTDSSTTDEPDTGADTPAETVTPETVAARVATAEGLNEERERSLAAALRFLREQEDGEAKTKDIVAAAYAEVPTYNDEDSWRSNLWNQVGGALQETGAVELENKSRGEWRWVG